MQVLVIYYDGFQHRAMFAETDTPDSAQPHVYGLPSDHDIVAVIVNPGKEAGVYIEEEFVLGVEP